MVTFRHGNILDAHLLTDQAPYSVIFCRNLLIYLDAAARSRALQVLDRLLTPHGVLFVGYAETGLSPDLRVYAGALSSSICVPEGKAADGLRPRSGARRGAPRPAAPASAFRLGSAAYTAWPRQPTAIAQVRQWPPSPAAPGAVAQEPSGARDTQASVLKLPGGLPIKES